MSELIWKSMSKQVDRRAGEDEAAGRIVELRKGVAVARPAAARPELPGGDDWGLAVEQVADSEPELEPLRQLGDGGEVEIILRRYLRGRGVVDFAGLLCEQIGIDWNFADAAPHQG